jgi:hypothetical membrane protein
MLSKDRTRALERIGASSGILSPIIGFVCIITAIATYPSFSWTNNALSDLGVVPGITASVFNFGLIASGLLAFNFAIFGLYVYFSNIKNNVGKIGSDLFASGALALIAIGVFNENYSPTHYLVSVAFFTLMPIALFIITYSFLLTHQGKIAAFTVLTGFAAAAPWILQFTFNYVPNVAIPEFLSGIIISVWTVTLASKMLKETNLTIA